MWLMSDVSQHLRQCHASARSQGSGSPCSHLTCIKHLDTVREILYWRRSAWALEHLRECLLIIYLHSVSSDRGGVRLILFWLYGERIRGMSKRARATTQAAKAAAGSA